MKEHLAQVLGSVATLAVVITAISWQISPIERSIEALRGDVHDIVQRVSHLEAQMDLVLERLPGTGRPASLPPTGSTIQWRAGQGEEWQPIYLPTGDLLPTPPVPFQARWLGGEDVCIHDREVGVLMTPSRPHARFGTPGLLMVAGHCEDFNILTP